MSWGYGTIVIEGVEGDDEAVRQAVLDLCSLLAESKLEFEIEIEMIGIIGPWEVSA